MSTSTKMCIALAALMMVGEIVLLIMGTANTRLGLAAVIWLAVGSLHMRADRLEEIANHLRALGHAKLHAIERQTDVIKGRR